MTPQDLETLRLQPESERLERKQSVSDREKIARTLCAFANDITGSGQPGILLVGLTDVGTCAGLEIDDNLLKGLSEFASDGNLQPFISLEVQRFDLKDGALAAVEVKPANFPPVRYKGRVYVRIGPTTREANADQERQLSECRRWRDHPFDLRPLRGESLEILDCRYFTTGYLPAVLPPDVLEKNQRTEQDRLAALRFIDLHEASPTVLGVLAIGREPTDQLPGAYIQFLRFDGTQLSDPIKDEKRITGPIASLLSELDGVMRINLSTAVEILGTDREIRRPDYPLAALQQIARNAVLHRNYEGTTAPVRISWFSDRVEIYSPGGPYGHVNRENFGQPGAADYRNPHLAEVMKNLGFVNKFGVGIAMANRELETNGNPRVDFTVEATAVLAILRPRRTP